MNDATKTSAKLQHFYQNRKSHTTNTLSQDLLKGSSADRFFNVNFLLSLKIKISTHAKSKEMKENESTVWRISETQSECIKALAGAVARTTIQMSTISHENFIRITFHINTIPSMPF